MSEGMKYVIGFVVLITILFIGGAYGPALLFVGFAMFAAMLWAILVGLGLIAGTIFKYKKIKEDNEA